MPTNAYIAVQSNDQVREIYLHWDGYLEHVQPLLLNHYNSLEKAQSLVNGGDISSLKESNECPEGHTFESPAKGHTTYYGRDRGETGVGFNSYTVEDYVGESCNDYQYMFNEGVWLYRTNSKNTWVLLAEATD